MYPTEEYLKKKEDIKGKISGSLKDKFKAKQDKNKNTEIQTNN
jgi:hypothetical protein